MCPLQFNNYTKNMDVLKLKLEMFQSLSILNDFLDLIRNSPFLRNMHFCTTRNLSC